MTSFAVYRGTQRPVIEGARKGLSWATSLPVAIIWSARPADPWSAFRGKPQILATSTIHAGLAEVKNPLELGRGETYVSLADVLRDLHYGKPRGISPAEVELVLNYLHNRLTGRAQGGEFHYRVFDEDDEVMDPSDLPFSLSRSETLFSSMKEDWLNEPTLETAERVIADTFIFADAPRVQEATMRLGHDAFVYRDLFSGGESASKQLLGVDVTSLEGIEEYDDLDGEYLPTHLTLRPIAADVVRDVRAVPAEQALAAWKSGAKGLARGRKPARSRRRSSTRL